MFIKLLVLTKRKPCMQLKPYLATLGRGGASKLAESLGVSASYLSQMASGKAPISPVRMVQIEQLTDASVTRKDEFTDWHLIWPELVTDEFPAPERTTEKAA